EDDGRVVALAPAVPLAPSTGYRVRVTTTVTDLAGHALAAPVTSGFTTAGPDLRGPRLVAPEPADGAAGVSVPPVGRACFDEPLDPASFGAGEEAALRVLDLAAGGAPRAGVLEPSPDARCLALVLEAPLAFETAYTVELLGTLRGADGNPVADAAGAPF